MLSDNIHGMISSVRIQYVLDRYLKKVRLPKYRDATVSKEQDIKDFKEILNLGYFTVGDLAQYYIIRKGKIPPALNPDFESLVYSMGNIKGKSPQKKQKVSSPKASSSKINLDNSEEFKKYFDSLEAEENKKGNKTLSKNLINQGFANPSKVTKKYLDTIKKNIKKEIENIVKDSEKEFKSNEISKTMYRKEMDAKNYNNDAYKNQKYFKRGTLQGLTQEEKLASQISKLSVKPKKSLPVTANEIEKIRKLVKGITIEEKQLKAKKTIKPNSPVKRKRSASISTAGSSKTSSPRISIKSSTSSKGSIIGYDSD